MNKKNTNIVQGTGYGIILAMILISIIGILGLVGILVVTFYDKFDNNLDWIYIVCGILMIIISCYYSIMYILSSKIYFYGDRIVVKYEYSYLKKINVNCSDIISYKIYGKKSIASVELETNKGIKYYLPRFNLTIRQLNIILHEIQKRGGLQDIEIKL